MKDWLVYLGYIEKFWSWKVLAPCSVFSSALFIMDSFSAFHDKMEAMNISNMITVFWLFCMACVVCKSCAWAGGKIERRTALRKIRTVLPSLTSNEVSMLLYVLDNSRGVVTWLPIDDPTAISLRLNGLLELAEPQTSKRLSWSSQPIECRAYSIPANLRPTISAYRANAWADVQPHNELWRYQNKAD